MGVTLVRIEDGDKDRVIYCCRFFPLRLLQTDHVDHGKLDSPPGILPLPSFTYQHPALIPFQMIIKPQEMMIKTH